MLDTGHKSDTLSPALKDLKSNGILQRALNDEVKDPGLRPHSTT